jgi:thiamine biosynthesis lipoprotein
MTTRAPVSFAALGTTATVVIDGGDADVARGVEAVRAEVAAIDLACSRFRPDSELSQLNAAHGRPTLAGPVLLEAVAVALRAARLTGGLVDPTVGGAMRALGYDRDFGIVRDRPDEGPVVTLVRRDVPGWRVVACDPETGMIMLPAGVELDLGATAKALAADRAAAAAARAAGCGALVSLGGDIAMAGTAPAGGWSVRVTDDHAAPLDAPGQTVSLLSGGLATSGTTVRRWRRGGRDVHHLLDPATGQPADAPWRTVSVAAASCVDANTASTAAVILGARAPAWLDRQGLPARLVATDGAVTCLCDWPQP